MPQSEYQIPFGEHSSHSENNVVAFERVTNKEAKENKYAPNMVASALDNVYRLYGDNSTSDISSVNPEIISKTSNKLYGIAEDLIMARQLHLEQNKSTRFDHAYLKSQVTESIIRVLFDRKLSSNYDKILTERELKNEEGEIGADIFGPIASNESRTFFNDNRESWFFHQEKTDSSKKVHEVTLHYEVRLGGVWRIDTKAGMKCEMISAQELDDFVNAAEIYHERVMGQIYKRPIRQIKYEQDDKLAA